VLVPRERHEERNAASLLPESRTASVRCGVDLRLTVALVGQGSDVRSRRGSISGNDRQEDFEGKRFMENLHVR